MFPEIIAALLDDAIVWKHRTAPRLYRELARNPHIYYEPKDVKAWYYARVLHTNREHVQKALELLIRRGYVIDCGRGQNGVRQVMLARDRRPCPETGQGKAPVPA